jgi:hypothetical protein
LILDAVWLPPGRGEYVPSPRYSETLSTRRSERSEESKMATTKNRNQGSIGQRNSTAGQGFRPLASLGVTGVTMKRPWE